MDLKILEETPPWDWPQDAGRIIQRTLLDRQASPSDRIVAAGLAGDICAIDDELADALLQIVGSADEPEDLRGKAAISLGPVLEQTSIDEFDDPYSEPPISKEKYDFINETLERLYADKTIPKEVRRRILEGSVRAPQDWHNAAIVTAYTSGDQEWILTAVFSMNYVRGLDRLILEALKSSHPDIQYQAVRAAGSWALDAAWPHVVGLLKDASTDKDLLIAAIEAASSIRPREAGPMLADFADSDDEEIAEAAHDALMMADGSEPEEPEEGEGGVDHWVN